ncbi:MAG TPA: tRNA threonylcarbamoyladenosine dehydratase [Candidatus Cloacimonadota bacterium]|nr:tRNA threonylcarbamoyladenosine dehydratase [Candidatus Cloacimonadota bacterium]HPT71888.1 tRNA threonylcarbamoyladenosine dehydratase [Candidatus Cloacimonadota bacterium]
MKDQFNRTELLFGSDAIKKLQQSRIAVIGLGGVGGYACESLARSGVGQFLLVDFDTIGPTNLNRQIIALHSTVGKPKVEVMRDRIKDINPEAIVDIYQGFCAIENREELLQNIDFIVDAIDSLGPKVGLLEFAYHQNMPIISVLGAGNRVDPSQVHLSDISDTMGCPLARRVRKFLRRRGIDKGIPVIYSSEVSIKEFAEDTTPLDESISVRGRSRVTIGSVGYMPAIMGMWAASYVIRNLATGYVYQKSQSTNEQKGQE